jgi:oxygen-independent coproporphyrinogen-3 oxidase
MAEHVKEAEMWHQPVPWLEPQGVYLHVPFCAHRCGYCDFATVAGRDGLAERYLQALDKELATLEQPRPVRTVFIGGGTPTHLSAPLLERLLHMVRRWFPLEPGYEWTVEANPGTLDPTKVRLLADYGVNRISLGAQSFHRPSLQFLERQHTPDDTARAIALVRRRLDNISLDLIFGVPGQTLADWGSDLRVALSLQPTHLSTYALTYEKGTPLWKQWRNGLVQPVSDALERAMYEEAMDALTAEGFEHYEISNFARPRFQCRHNLIYWANHAYWGFGLGATGYVRGTRSSNTRDLETYLHRLEQGLPPHQYQETLDPLQRACETAMLQIRRSIGIEREAFATQTGWHVDSLFAEAVQRHTEAGLLEDSGRAVFLTREGKLFADLVASSFLEPCLQTADAESPPRLRPAKSL